MSLSMEVLREFKANEFKKHKKVRVKHVFFFTINPQNELDFFGGWRERNS